MRWCFVRPVQEMFLEFVMVMGFCKCFLHSYLELPELIFAIFFWWIEECIPLFLSPLVCNCDYAEDWRGRPFLFLGVMVFRSCSRCGKVLKFDNYSTEATFVKNASGQVCYSFSCIVVSPSLWFFWLVNGAYLTVIRKELQSDRVCSYPACVCL